MKAPLLIFLWGCAGSIAVEIINLYSEYQKPKIEIPERYSRVGYWVVRVLLTFMAGSIALAYGIEKPLLALNIGAATPVLIQTLSQGVAPQLNSQKAALRKKFQG